jgi:hypothetical protein
MTHGELKKNANTSDAGAQRRGEKQRQIKRRDRREAQTQTERERSNTREAVKTKAEMSARSKADLLQQNLHL